MFLRVLVGAGIGVVLGLLVGYYGRCSGGVCPTGARSRRGAFLGAVFGAIIGALWAVASVNWTAQSPPSGRILEISDVSQFDKETAAGPVVADFYADWCEPCRELAPILETISGEFAGRAGFVRVNVDKLQPLARRYGVSALPTVLMFSGGREVRKIVGLHGAGDYRRAITAILPAATAPAQTQTRHDNHKETSMAQTVAATSRTGGTVTMKGKPVQLTGRALQVGDKAPDFELVDNSLAPVTLESTRGATRIILSLPSLDTSVCDTEARRFNVEASKLSAGVRVLVISMDLPFAQKRWCAAAGVANVQTLSDYQKASFGSDYGVLMKDLRLLARAVFVVDGNDRIRYIQVVDEIGREPDYDAALNAVRQVAGG